ncbi:MAG: glycosyltransferase family 2 protein [Lachnospiraceae bacterium]|nr:glycosyltransferase family 2 protein [Lachnospiraceae bacterium]
MNKVTVVIPNYNGEKWLKGCLDSLDPSVQNSAVTYDIIVVDDASTDKSRDIVSSYPGVKLISLEKNGGFSRAVNAGISASDSPYVILLNNDTKAKPGFVQSLYNAIKKDNRCFSVSASMRMWDREELMDSAGDLYCALGWSRSRGKGRPASRYARACRVFSACAGAAIYRKAVFDEIGLFDPLHYMYLEDLDICWRALLAGYTNRYDPGAVVIHYGSATTGSRYNSRKALYSASNNIYVIYKNMSGLQLLINLPLLLAGFAAKTVFFFRKGLGKDYLKGLADGFGKCIGKGRSRRHKGFVKIIPRLARIELMLLRNIFTVFTDT